MTKIKNFTPLLDSLVKEHGLITAAVWGRVYRYEQMSSGKCVASHETLSEGLNISKRTLIRHLDILIDKEYITDHTPERRNKPHDLTTTRKARLEITLEAIDEGVTESHTGVTESHTESDRESHEESSKKESKKQKIKESAASAALPPEPPPPKPKSSAGKKRDERLDHPAIVAYKDLARLTPPFAARDAICAVLDVEKWRGVVQTWISKGWRRDNIDGMLDVYRTGGRTNGHAAPPPNAFLETLKKKQEHTHER